MKELARGANRSRDHPKSDLGQETVEGATKNSGDPWAHLGCNGGAAERRRRCGCAWPSRPCPCPGRRSGEHGGEERLDGGLAACAPSSSPPASAVTADPARISTRLLPPSPFSSPLPLPVQSMASGGGTGTKFLEGKIEGGGADISSVSGRGGAAGREAAPTVG